MAGLKIMQLSSEKSWRGGEQQIAYLIEYLRSQEIEIVVCARKDSAFAKWCEQNNIQFFEMAFANGMDIYTAIKIKKIAENNGVDIVNTHSGKSHSIAYLALRLGMKTPVVVHRRVDFPLKTSGFSLKKYNHPGIKSIVCVSEAIARLVKKVIDRPEIVETVYSGIDPTRFSHNAPRGYIHREFNIDPSQKLIANISALAPHKDYETFLETARKVVNRRKDCHFLIVGSGELEDDLKRQAIKLKLEGQLTFTGFRKDIPQLFRELSLFLITSDTEGLGTTVIDALCNGLPVVATRAGGIPELINDGEEGYLCDVGDANCLAQSVENILDSKETRAMMRKNAVERAKKFTNIKMGEGVFRVYRSVAQRNKE